MKKISNQQKQEIAEYVKQQASLLLYCYETAVKTAADKELPLTEESLVSMGQTIYIDVVRCYKLNQQ